MSAAVGRSLRCERCGAAFQLAELSPRVFCPFCGHEQSAATLVGELSDYQQAVDRGLRAADEEYQRVAGWERWSERRSTGKVLIALYASLAGGTVVLASLLYALVAAGVLARGTAFSIGAMGSPLFGLAGYFLWYAAGRKEVTARAATAGEANVACPRCGAPGTLTSGQMVDRCAYCGASLVPSPAVIQRGVDSARATRRQAAMQRYRAERQTAAQTAGYQAMMGAWMPVFGIGLVAVMMLVTCVGFTYKMAVGTEEPHPGILILWGMVIAAAGAIHLLLRWRRDKRRTWRAGLAGLARQFGGRVHLQLAGWIGWLSSYWAGEYSLSELLTLGGADAAAVDAAGFPALVIAEPSSLPRATDGHLEILLAAWVPGLSDETGPAPTPTADGAAAQAWLEGQGFELRLTEAGVRARVDADKLRALEREPAALHQLAPVLVALAALAAAAGAEPAEPIP